MTTLDLRTLNPSDVSTTPPAGTLDLRTLNQSDVSDKAPKQGVLESIGSDPRVQGLIWLADKAQHFLQPEIAKKWVRAIANDPSLKSVSGYDPLGAMAGGMVAPRADAPKVDVSGIASSVVDAATSPMTYAGLALKIPSVLKAITSGSTKATVGLASGLSGISKAAIEFQASPEGREAIHALTQGGTADLKEGVQQVAYKMGQDMIDKLDNAHDYLLELDKVKQAAEQGGKGTLTNMITALENSKHSPRDGILLGKQRAENEAIQSIIDDFKSKQKAIEPDQVLSGLEDNAANKSQDLSIVKSVSEKSNKQAESAARMAERAKITAGTRAGQAGAASKSSQEAIDDNAILTDSEKGAPEIAYTPTELKQIKANADYHLQRAKDASAKAKETYQDAQVKQAAGLYDQDDLEAAKHAASSADRNVKVMDAAYQLANGKKPHEVASSLFAKYGGAEGSDLNSILQEAKSKVKAGLPTESDLEISNAAKLQLRRDLDQQIPYEAANPQSSQVAKARFNARQAAKQDLVTDLGPEYAKDMSTLADKLDVVGALRKKLGTSWSKSEVGRETAAQNIAKKIIAGDPATVKFAEAIDKIFGTSSVADAASTAKTAKLAGEFGKSGQPGLFPRNYGPILESGWLAHLMNVPGMKAVLAASASPKITTRVLVPLAKKAGTITKIASSPISPTAIAGRTLAQMSQDKK